MPCELMGTGMAFPWHIISDADMGGGTIVEDMQVGIELALQGHPARFCSAALVTSSFPTAEQDAGTQRRRWEYGHISMILAYAPKLLLAALRQRDVALLVLGLGLMAPPLALHSLLLLVGLILTASAVPFGLMAPFLALLSGCLLFVLALLLAWYRFARHNHHCPRVAGYPRLHCFQVVGICLFSLLTRIEMDQDWLWR